MSIKHKKSLNLARMTHFSSQLINWYLANGRQLPWRSTKNPYRIWLSEIILQQTRIEQGTAYYQRFVEEFPTVNDLANAPADDVMRLWQGLGYYSRARNLQATAKIVAQELGGQFPGNYKDLLALKGIGDYTASAIASFAFGEVEPVLDGNVFRVISRVFGIKEDIAVAKSRKVFKAILNQLIDPKQPDIFNQAIMDFGSQHCKPKSPLCSECIFAQECYAMAHDQQASLPLKTKKIKRTKRYIHYLLISDGQKYLLKKRTSKDIWAELYDFPMVDSKTELDMNESLKTILGNQASSIKVQEPNKKHVLSHQDVFTQFAMVKVSDLSDFEYQAYTLDQIKALPKPILIENFLRQSVY